MECKIIRVKTSRSVLSVVIEATQANITDNTHMQLNAVTHTHTQSMSVNSSNLVWPGSARRAPCLVTLPVGVSSPALRSFSLQLSLTHRAHTHTHKKKMTTYTE